MIPNTSLSPAASRNSTIPSSTPLRHCSMNESISADLSQPQSQPHPEELAFAWRRRAARRMGPACKRRHTQVGPVLPDLPLICAELGVDARSVAASMVRDATLRVAPHHEAGTRRLLGNRKKTHVPMFPTTKTPSILTGCPGLRHSPMDAGHAYFIVHLSWKRS